MTLTHLSLFNNAQTASSSASGQTSNTEKPELLSHHEKLTSFLTLLQNNLVKHSSEKDGELVDLLIAEEPLEETEEIDVKTLLQDLKTTLEEEGIEIDPTLLDSLENTIQSIEVTLQELIESSQNEEPLIENKEPIIETLFNQIDKLNNTLDQITTSAAEPIEEITSIQTQISTLVDHLEQLQHSTSTETKTIDTKPLQVNLQNVMNDTTEPFEKVETHLETVLQQLETSDNDTVDETLKKLINDHLKQLKQMQPKPDSAQEQSIEVEPNSHQDELKNNIKSQVHQKILNRFQDAMDKAPDQAKPLIKAMITKFQTKTNNTHVNPTNPIVPVKSIQQLQLEYSLEVPADELPSENLEQLNTLKPSSASTSQTSSHQNTPSNFNLLDTFVQPTEVEAVKLNPVNTNNTIESIVASHKSEGAAPSPHEQVVQSMKLTLESGKKEISLQLQPAYLGHLRLSLQSSEQGTVSARIVTQTAEAKQALDGTVDQLVRSLEEQGLKVGRISIVQAPEETSDKTFWSADRDTGSQHYNQQQSGHASTLSQQENFHDDSAFTDGGSSLDDETSSEDSFDTDVEGEEVHNTTLTVGEIDLKA